MIKQLLILFSLLMCIVTDGNAQGYYPLQVGNVWQYSYAYFHYDSCTTFALNDTIMPNGFTYLHVYNSFIFGDEYFRQSGSKVYRYSLYSETEELFYDFSKTTSDTVAIHCYQYDTSTVMVVYDKMANVFGSVRRVWGFSETYRHSTFYALREVTDSIGPTDYTVEPGINLTLHGAILNGKIYGSVTGVESQTSFIPKKFQLFQNYPNPFNPTTLIKYDLPKSLHVRLTVYDVLGKGIATLVNELQNPGIKSVMFDGTSLPSGVYFYRLEAGLFSETKKLLLIR